MNDLINKIIAKEAELANATAELTKYSRNAGAYKIRINIINNIKNIIKRIEELNEEIENY